MFKVASLFCGLGGSDLGILGGFTFLGHFYPRLFFDIVFAVDLDKHAVETYNKLPTTGIVFNSFQKKCIFANIPLHEGIFNI